MAGPYKDTALEVRALDFGQGVVLRPVTFDGQPGMEFIGRFRTNRLDRRVYLRANSVHATAATFATVGDLVADVISGHTYIFEAHLFHITNATTTGAQFGIGGVAMTSMVAGAISTVTNSATAATLSTGVATAVDTAVVVQTTGAAANAPTIMSGWFQPSADGTFAIRATSEVTVGAGLTVLAGSWLRIWETDN